MAAMLGPVDVAVIEFEGSRLTTELASALANVVEPGIVRIIDLVFVTRDEQGSVSRLELDDVDPDVADAIWPLTDEVSGLLSEEDVRRIGERLGNDRSAALIVLEHAWLGRVRAALAGVNGRVLAHERIPAEVVERAMAAREEDR